MAGTSLLFFKSKIIIYGIDMINHFVLVQVQKLVEMGFPESQVRSTLEIVGGDENMALEKLLSSQSLLQKPNLETAESYTEERVFWTAGDSLRHFFCCGCIHLIDWQLPLMEEFVAGTICVNQLKEFKEKYTYFARSF